jgi:L,D-transpeptidase catalytic domain
VEPWRPRGKGKVCNPDNVPKGNAVSVLLQRLEGTPKQLRVERAAHGLGACHNGLRRDDPSGHACNGDADKGATGNYQDLKIQCWGVPDRPESAEEVQMARHRTIQRVLALCIMSVGLCASALADSVPFWGAKESVPIDTPIAQLKKGQFLWMAEAVTTGPVVMVVSITEQRAYVYRNGILIGATTVSTGRPGHLTPTGVFTVLQKQKEHHSTIYDGAPMPYMERLTWGGVALHAGGLPGYPESHGCVHLPSEFARRLFEISPNGMTVVIGTEATAPEQVAHPGYLAPVKFAGGEPIDQDPLAPSLEDRWQPEVSATGPVSIVLSQGSQRMVVYRNGIEIGRSRVLITGDTPLINHALVLTAGPSSVPDPYVPDPTRFSWLRVGVPGHMGEQGSQVDPTAVSRIKLPPDFAARLNGILTPGATLFVTRESLYPQTTGPIVQVVDADPPGGAKTTQPRKS